jgi:hypothetical protein
VALLLAGLACAALAPAELYCFSFFVQGGRFHYPGFQFGSFLFAFLAVQIVGYYAIALVCVPLGLAHLRLRRWARNIALAGLGFWWVVGIPLAVLFMAVLVTSKDPSLAMALTGLLGMVALYPLAPLALGRFYRSEGVQATLESADPGPDWSAGVPVPIWTLCMLLAFWIAALHLAVLLHGAFPLFGRLAMDWAGILCIDASILWLAAVAWGSLRRWAWAWWGALAFFSLGTISTVGTFARLSWAEILAAMRFAPLEVQALDGIPASGWHLAGLIAVPLVGTLVAILRARRCF